MLKTFALIARRPDIDRDEFCKHYEEVHAPLALPLLEGLVRYVRYHVKDVVYGAPGFDVISGFWYWSAEAAMATVGRVQAPEGEAIRADEQRFMDTARNTFFAAAPELRIGADELDEGSDPLFVLVKAGGEGARRYLRGFDESAWPALVDVLGTPEFALYHRALGAGEPTSYDLALQLRVKEPVDAEALARWSLAQEAEGAHVVVVRTRLYESETPWELPS